MKIVDIIPILNMQKSLKRTSCGRPITDVAIAVINASLEDEKNYESDAILCENCCIIMSSLLVPSGCPNCGVKDMTYNIGGEIKKENDNG